MRAWKNLSISKKLYFVVGIMAILIATELLILRFSMHQLSAVRAFVGGESLWSKAQKNSAFSLQRFALTRNEEDYHAFLDYLRVPEGDHLARLELEKQSPNLSAVTEGFRAGGLHPDDIKPMTELIRGFYWEKHLAIAIHVWQEADEILERFKNAGEEYHRLTIDPKTDSRAVDFTLGRIRSLNLSLTRVEEEFSEALGEGSRWLEHAVIALLLMAVMMVETVGLSLTFLTSRSISKGLANLNTSARRIGKGDYGYVLKVESQDEIGTLAESMNQMSKLLESSYQELESRVKARTHELSQAATDNARLYKEAQNAVRMREEFLAVASHEFRTPLTALTIQLQILERVTQKLPTTPESVKVLELATGAVTQGRRLTRLSRELMDLTQFKLGQFELHRERCDLTAIVAEITSQMTPEAAQAGSVLSFQTDGPIFGEYDGVRIGQVVTNLISNAVKYGNKSPIDVVLWQVKDHALLEVRDFGKGIPEDKLGTVFERFERVERNTAIEGLGLGLYISKQIVLAHGGRIFVKSSAGEGSTFTVELGVKS